MRISLLVVVCVMTLPSWVVAGSPDIVNSEMVIEPVEADLTSSVEGLLNRQSGARWVGWSVPAVQGDRVLCCWDHGDKPSRRGSCSLVRRSRHFVTSEGRGVERLPSEARDLAVLVRADDSRVEEVRVYSETCRLDAEGQAVTWLEGARVEDSVAWLASLIGRAVEQGDPEDLAEEALMALALHRGSAADRELAALADSGAEESPREEAIFWLGEARGQAGLQALDSLLESETNPELRTHVAFALTLSSAPGAVERLTTLARQDPDPEVRGEALFWLGQEGGAGAAAAIRRSVEADPSRDVRRQAIFALSQLPDGQGTDLLLDIVRDRSQEATARQEALFWLAQSEDDRALDLISGLLK